MGFLDTLRMDRLREGLSRRARMCSAR